VPGTDGQKMSKSYHNFIDIFLPEKELDKQIKTIITDATPLESPKNPDTCNVFKLYSLLATNDLIMEMRANYINGNYGYGHAKKALFELICDRFRNERIAFNKFMNNEKLLEEKLQIGEQKAMAIAIEKLDEVRTKLGFK
jgi:tryptophanyl-tRNA synthetase